MTDTRDTRRRVKLYALNAERQWDDRGTGHVSCTYLDRHKGVSLLVRAETDGKMQSVFQHYPVVISFGLTNLLISCRISSIGIKNTTRYCLSEAAG